jgi:elongation factor P--beta-lysine ligase
MSNPTWGLRIPGYSYPSPAQERAFKRMHPGVWADHVAQKHLEHQERCDRFRRYNAILEIANGLGHEKAETKEQRDAIWDFARQRHDFGDLA